MRSNELSKKLYKMLLKRHSTLDDVVDRVQAITLYLVDPVQTIHLPKRNLK